MQIDIFNSVLEKLKKKNVNLKYIHIANSSAILQNQYSYYNSVRAGIAIYGISPLGELNTNLKVSQQTFLNI